MKISTKGRYALRLLVDLAEHRDDGFVALRDIAERQGVSKKYLEQIVPPLNRQNILQTNRGYQGGYRLAVPPEKCTVGEVLRITEGSLSPIACLDDAGGLVCDRAEDCTTLYVWQGLKKVIDEYLDSITLQDILDNKRAGNADDYVI